MVILIIWLVIASLFFYGFIFSFAPAFGGDREGVKACIGATLVVSAWAGAGTLIYYTIKEIAKHIV